MKTKLMVFLLMSFVFTTKAQCWSENDKIYPRSGDDSRVIRTDGTLCAMYFSSGLPPSYHLIQLGAETNWYKYIQNSIFLKTDGTLWKENIPTNYASFYSSLLFPGTNWIDVQNKIGLKTDGTIWKFYFDSSNEFATPTQIGTDTDWANLIYTDNPNGPFLAKKTDGSLWVIYGNSIIAIPGIWTEFEDSYTTTLGIKNDGTLWRWTDSDLYYNTPTQIGTDTDWVKIGKNNYFAHKANGTIWQINGSVATQIGTDTDWESSKGDIARKTDGSYWAKGAYNTLYNSISYVSNPDYDQFRKILPEGTYIDYTLERQCEPYMPGWCYYNIVALNNNNELFAWGQFGFSYQAGVNITYSNRVQIGCNATLNTNENTQKKLSVFPNPVTDILNIQTENQLNKAEIFDLGGRLLLTQPITDNQLKMSQLQSGIYFVKLIGVDSVYGIKVSKE